MTILADFQKRDAHERCDPEIERLHEGRNEFARFVFRNFRIGKRKRNVRVNVLHRLSVDDGKRSAQAVMARNQALERRFHPCSVQLAFDQHGRRHVVADADSFKLIENVHALLRRRNRVVRLLLRWLDRENVPFGSLFDERRQFLNRRFLEQDAERNIDLVFVVHARYHPHGTQGVAAEREKVVLHAHLRNV